VAADPTAWLRLLALDGDLAAAKPKTLRFQMLHVPASLRRACRDDTLAPGFAAGRFDAAVTPHHDTVRRATASECRPARRNR
jgi:hypothetical protein